jgi:hypothetical protein
MANLALPSTSEFPPDPSELGRQELNVVYLELRHNYERLMRSRGQYRRLSAEHCERLGDQNLEYIQQRQQWQAELAQQGEELRAVLERETRLKAETYALLASVADLIENLEDAGDALSTSFGSFQLGKRRAGPAGSAGGTLAGVGGGMPQLMKGVLHFLNRWREGKQRFKQLISQREALNTLLEEADGRDH